MNVVKKIGIVGVGPYKKPAVLDVVPGITVLYGKNNLNEGNGNASGKSVLVSSLADIFYDEPIIGTKQDKPKIGKRFVTFQQGDKVVKVMSAFNKGEKLQIVVDGKDVSGRTSTLTRSEMPTYWPVTKEEFSTYGYIDASVPHPLARGSSVDRKSFFNSFFRLDQMDAEKRVFMKAMQDIKKVKASHTELNRVFLEIKNDMLSKTDRESKEAQLADLNAELAVQLKSQTRAQEVQALLRFESQVKADLALVPSDLDNLDDDYKQAKADLREAESLVEQLEEYKTFVLEARRYRAATADLDMDTPLEELEAASKALAKAEARLETLADVEEPTEPSHVDKPEGDLATYEAEERKLKHSLAHSRRFESGVCGECGQAVAKVSIPKIEKALTTVQAKLEKLRRYSKWEARKAAYDAEFATWESAQAEVKATTKSLVKLKAKAELYKKRVRIFKPTKVEKPGQGLDVAQCRERLRVLEFAATNKDMIVELRGLSKADRRIEHDDRKLESLQSKVYALKTKLDMHNMVKGKATKIRTRLAELSNSLEKEEDLALILEAYNDKAMKKMAIEAISRQLMVSVNRYSALVFDDYHFEFVWGTQIQILVYRGKEPPTDVRKLSGAESMLFTLILVLSLLVFVPKSRRLSLLILDEPTASFSEGTIDLFHKLLPHVTQVIPSVIVVTPKAGIRLEGARELTVVRDRDGATLVKGHPDEL